MQIMRRNHKAVSVALCPVNVFPTHQSSFNLRPKTMFHVIQLRSHQRGLNKSWHQSVKN